MLTLIQIGKVTEPLFKSRRHYHDTWEICLYTAGEGEALIGEQRVPFKPGTIICYPPAIPHEEISPGGCLEYFINTAGTAAAPARVAALRESPVGSFERLAARLYEEFHLRERGWEQITEHLFRLMLAYIDRWQGQDQHPQVVALKRLIMQGFANPDFNAADAMANLPMCKDHLRRLFVRMSGVTPSVYLRTLRIEEAKRLLQVLRLGVKETTWQVGFRDQAHFSRIFRKHTGQWPTEFVEAPLPKPAAVRYVL